MTGLQDENSFSAGGGAAAGTTKKQVAQIARPDPDAVASMVNQQITLAKQAAASAKKVAQTEFDANKSDIADKKADSIDDASIDRAAGVLRAFVPVAIQEIKIEGLEAQLHQARIDLAAKKVVFSAKKGELKTAYKTAVAGIKEAATSEIRNARSTRALAVQSAQEALDKAIADGADTVAQEIELLDAYDNWQSEMKWEGRKAGFNAVAATVKAIVEAVQTTYRENRNAARAHVEVPEALLKRTASPSEPQPPSA